MKTFKQWLEMVATEDITPVVLPMANLLEDFLTSKSRYAPIYIPRMSARKDEDPNLASKGVLLVSSQDKSWKKSMPGEEEGDLWIIKIHPTLSTYLDEINPSVLDELKRSVIPEWKRMFQRAGWEVKSVTGDQLGLEVVEPIGHEFISKFG
jgi:hypothetical protein